MLNFCRRNFKPYNFEVDCDIAVLSASLFQCIPLWLTGWQIEWLPPQLVAWGIMTASALNKSVHMNRKCMIRVTCNTRIPQLTSHIRINIMSTRIIDIHVIRTISWVHFTDNITIHSVSRIAIWSYWVTSNISIKLSHAKGLQLSKCTFSLKTEVSMLLELALWITESLSLALILWTVGLLTTDFRWGTILEWNLTISFLCNS